MLKKNILKVLSLAAVIAPLASCNNNTTTDTSITNSIAANNDSFFNKGIVGNSANGVYNWLGIRYAKAASRFNQSEEFGDRYEYPNKAGTEDADATATSYKNYNYQSSSVAKDAFNGSPSEDCLFLNIFAPTTIKTKTLTPVYVHFHGGNFQEGTANDNLYDGSYLASKGVIVVTVEYRDNIFGFMNANGQSNIGLNDQLNALRFVYNHIDTFGGDKSNITIGGDGSGSASISSFFYCDKAKNEDGTYLFKRAILNNQTIFNTKYFKGKTSTSTASADFISTFGKDIKTESAASLYGHTTTYNNDKNVSNFFYPSFEGGILKDPGTDLLKGFADASNSVEILLGYSTSYAKNFINFYVKNKANFANEIGTTESDLETSILKKGIEAPLYAIADKVANSYFYIIDDENFTGNARFISNETPLIFNNWNYVGNSTQNDRSLGNKFSDMYTNFIRGYDSTSNRSVQTNFTKFNQEGAKKYTYLSSTNAGENKNFDTSKIETGLEKGI